MSIQDDAAHLVTEVVKAGTSEGAKKGWQKRGHGRGSVMSEGPKRGLPTLEELNHHAYVQGVVDRQNTAKREEDIKAGTKAGDMTPGERSQVIDDYFVKMPLKELRRRQGIVAGQLQSAPEGHPSIRHLQIHQKMLDEAVDRKEFPGDYKKGVGHPSDKKGVRGPHADKMTDSSGHGVIHGLSYTKKSMYVTARDASSLFPEFMPELKSLDQSQLLDLDELVSKAKEGGKLDTSDPGLFTRCIKTAGAKKSSDPNAYCAAVHHKITGRWPAEDPDRKKSK